MSKDADFLDLLETFGIPPPIIWITCRNTTNANMCNILNRTLKQALQILIDGEQMVEISDILN